MEDWDLQAVVRGFSCEDILDNPPSLFAPLRFNHDELLKLPEGLEIITDDDLDGLQGFYNSFYTVLHQPLSPKTMSCTTTSILAPIEVKEPRKVPREQHPLLEPVDTSASRDCAVRAVKSRKSRKNQNKKIVQQVTADGLSSDTWAWRKYGQKPIKGSPYPRSYYRCSSLKGCLARKQVERSKSDPSVFIITYSAEHSHAHPTRRSALAGITRAKNYIPKEPTPREQESKTLNEEKHPSSPKLELVPSPQAPSTAFLEDEPLQRVSIENEQQQQPTMEDDTFDKAFDMMAFGADLFPSLEDFEGFFSDEFVNLGP
ncbi:hypothetical protein K2173_022575 [Erythroxylum novogranatense]|uniref:WRKY domain-containing protein n=1 Tax=Erythroxylum novogranatense TaxID=1862640 RepID=A0AAV8TNI2_9ROSI|nr:hypothetical protein K2173_022575 [Erythroxylum novogranatense]